MGFSAKESGTGSPAAYLEYASLTPASNGIIDAELDAISVAPEFANTFALNTWHTFRVVSLGGHYDFYFNSTFKYGVGLSSSQIEACHVYLYGYQTDAWFKNFKVWTLSTP